METFDAGSRIKSFNAGGESRGGHIHQHPGLRNKGRRSGLGLRLQAATCVQHCARVHLRAASCTCRMFVPAPHLPCVHARVMMLTHQHAHSPPSPLTFSFDHGTCLDVSISASDTPAQGKARDDTNRQLPSHTRPDNQGPMHARAKACATRVHCKHERGESKGEDELTHATARRQQP